MPLNTERHYSMSKRILLGMLTPSSNTVLEPVTTQMIAGLPEASAHFGRFRVTEIALSDQALLLLPPRHVAAHGQRAAVAAELARERAQPVLRAGAQRNAVPGPRARDMVRGALPNL